MSKGLWYILAAGTGGHVIPALAIAKALQRAGYTVRWIGTPHGIEQRLVPLAHIPLDTVTVTGLRGKGLLGWLKAPFRVSRALLQLSRLFRQHRPVAVLGMGGYVSGPGGLAAWLCRIPLIIHEQNAIPGLTNRLLMPMAHRVMTAFPHTFAHAPKAVHTGNPVRETLFQMRAHTAHQPLKLLVVGGSQGARAINDVVVQLFTTQQDFELLVWHQTGPKDYDRIQTLYDRHDCHVQVSAYIDDMDKAYDWADCVLCRAGAMTVSELTATGKPSILVPYPYAVDDHQTHNARFLSEAGAAILLPQSELTADKLTVLLQHLSADPDALKRMSRCARALAAPEATQTALQYCLEVIRD